MQITFKIQVILFCISILGGILVMVGFKALYLLTDSGEPNYSSTSIKSVWSSLEFLKYVTR